MTRLAAIPRHDPPPLPLSPAQVELGRIRMRVSHVAALLSRKPERILWAIGQLEAEVERLRQLLDTT